VPEECLGDIVPELAPHPGPDPGQHKRHPRSPYPRRRGRGVAAEQDPGSVPRLDQGPEAAEQSPVGRVVAARWPVEPEERPSLGRFVVRAEVREAVEVPEDDPVGRDTVTAGQFLQHSDRMRSALQVDGDDRASGVVRGGRGCEHVAGMGVEVVEVARDLDQAGARRKRGTVGVGVQACNG